MVESNLLALFRSAGPDYLAFREEQGAPSTLFHSIWYKCHSFDQFIKLPLINTNY